MNREFFEQLYDYTFWADHRVQTIAMLHTQFGAPTFEQDFLSYLHHR